MAAEHIATRGLLTVSLLKRLLTEPLVRESFIAEGTIKGLFLLRRPAGAVARHPNRASWLLRWSAGSKTKKKMSLGDARTISLDAARRSAQAYLATVVQGRDPAQERRERRGRLTVDDIWTAYTADPAFTSKAAGTRYKDRNRYQLHVAERVGRKVVDDLTVPSVESLIAAIRTDSRTGRRGRRIGGEGSAKKVIRLLGAMTAWALRRKLVKTNPFSGHAFRADGTRTVLVEGLEFHSIFAALDSMEADGRLPPVKARVLRVIWATAARRSEITGLRWRHVRLDDARIIVPADEHKGGRVAARRGRDGVSRVIDLPPVAYEAIVAQVPSGAMPAPDELVFPPMIAGTEQLELSRVWREVRRVAGLPKTIVLHSARHSIATAGAMAGMTNTQLAAVLGHAQTRTTERYSDLARSRKQRLGRVAFDAAMGAAPLPARSHVAGDNVIAIGNKE